jgi:hypothetical protein
MCVGVIRVLNKLTADIIRNGKEKTKANKKWADSKMAHIQTGDLVLPCF